MGFSRRFWSWLVTILILAAVGWAWLARQNIYDWWRLRGYSPPVAIANLATADTMDVYARHIFYVNHPQLVSNSTTFNSYCSTSEQTIILGCYHGSQTGIYVYAVTDSRLQGIEEVTSAHEMLHAAYDRLSSKDKRQVDAMINDFYQNGLNDQRIKDTIDAYRKSEPNDLVNEMHSIFGTEVANLPSALEKYYKRYFSDRAAIVAFSNNYENEFTSRKATADRIESQLKTLKAKIDTEESSLQAQLQAINSEQARLDGLRSSGQVAQYNAGVAAFNAKVDAYNAGVATYKANVSLYNSLVNQFNAAALELNQLYGAIDSRLQTQSTR